MTTVNKAVLGIILASGALFAHAGSTGAEKLEQCKSKVADYYGGVKDLQFVSQRRFRDGTQMKFAVHNQDAKSGYTHTRMATCWLGNENGQSFAGRSSEKNAPMVADVYDAITSSIVEPIGQ